MKPFSLTLRSVLDNQDGSVIVAAMLILVVVTLLGITATNTSTVELQIASNDQFAKMAFFNADGAIYGSAKLISHAINQSDKVIEGSGGDAPGLIYLPDTASDPDDDFYRQIMAFEAYDAAPDIDFNQGGIDAIAEVRRDREGYVSGSGVEFASAAEGVGYSAIAVYYDINTIGSSNRQTNKNLNAYYRKLVGVAGGL